MKTARVWSRLENAAKIFPTTSTKGDPKVFRLSCEFQEPVQVERLRRALTHTLVEFPQYRFVLRKGLFWHYFEQSDMEPDVAEETAPPCQPLYWPDQPSLLFRITYYKNRVNLEIFHALSDGTGAMQFLRTLVLCYLILESSGDAASPDLQTMIQGSQEQFQSDAFRRYFDRKHPAVKSDRIKAYRLRGARLPDAQLGLIEGVTSTKAILDAAHTYGATITEYITAVLILSILDVMPSKGKKTKPIVITVPLDLRKFFPSFTVRNFFGFIRVIFTPGAGPVQFEDVLAQVQSSMKEALTQANAEDIITRYMALESHPLVRIIPLGLKIVALRIAASSADAEDTAALSNLGRVTIPEAYAHKIKRFSVFVTTKRPQLCICSFGDTLSITVSSPLASTELQRSFFQKLSSGGLDLSVVSNLGEFSGAEPSPAPKKKVPKEKKKPKPKKDAS